MEKDPDQPRWFSIKAIDETATRLECIYTGAVHEVETAAVVMVTARTPVDSLYYSLNERIACAVKSAPLRSKGNFPQPRQNVGQPPSLF